MWNPGASSGPETPSPARMYDYYLGGKDNFEADRVAAEAVLAIGPEAREAARGNRVFLVNAVRRLATEGITQFLDIGAGIPTSPNVHEVAQEINPASRVVYVDNDPVVLTHTRALRARHEGVLGLEGDVRRPAEILASPELNRVLDLDKPVAVLLVAVLHFVTDAEDPAAIVRTLHDRLAPGSALILSHATAPPAAWARAMDAAGGYDNATARFSLRKPDQIEELFGPWTPACDLAPVATWPEWSTHKGPYITGTVAYHS